MRRGCGRFSAKSVTVKPSGTIGMMVAAGNRRGALLTYKCVRAGQRQVFGADLEMLARLLVVTRRLGDQGGRARSQEESGRRRGGA